MRYIMARSTPLPLPIMPTMAFLVHTLLALVLATRATMAASTLAPICTASATATYNIEETDRNYITISASVVQEYNEKAVCAVENGRQQNSVVDMPCSSGAGSASIEGPFAEDSYKSVLLHLGQTSTIVLEGPGAPGGPRRVPFTELHYASSDFVCP